MKETLVLVFSDLRNDSRVNRQIGFLKKVSHVTIVCFDAEKDPELSLIKIRKTNLTLTRKALMSIFLLLRQFKVAYWLFHDYRYLTKTLGQKKFDLIVANDADTLPLAYELKNEAKILFDAHEYSPRHFENNAIWRIFFQPFYLYLCNKYIPVVDEMITVGSGIAREYESKFQVKCGVITNATGFHGFEPTQVGADSIRMVHHGVANKSRSLELMIDLMNHLDTRFSLDLYLVLSDFASPQTKKYLSELKKKVALNNRVKILPPIPNSDLVNKIHEYDLGVILIPPVNFNYANGLPNKLFEFIQARLGLAIGPTPEIAEIVNHYQIGVVADDFNPPSLAEKLNRLSNQDIMQFKTNSNLAALEMNADKNEAVFHKIFNRLVN